MKRALGAVRSALQLVAMSIAVIPIATLVLLYYLGPVRTRYRLAQLWTRFAIWSAAAICGIRWQVEGRENLPDGPAILLPKHQSAWETLWLQAHMPRPLTFVYKRELQMVPFFGWALASLQMINIDRRRGQDAFEQVVEQGTERLARGWWIVIFPEGTRTAPGATRRFKSGGARLALRTGAPAVPIALNSGECWPRNAFIKSPGLITVSIGPPIDPAGLSADQLSARVEGWIEHEMRRLAPHRYSGPYVAAGRQPGGERPASGNAAGIV
jgi:1-acyl-sn-glycerol-3-phosphate acyltransferase